MLQYCFMILLLLTKYLEFASEDLMLLKFSCLQITIRPNSEPDLTQFQISYAAEYRFLLHFTMTTCYTLYATVSIRHTALDIFIIISSR